MELEYVKMKQELRDAKETIASLKNKLMKYEYEKKFNECKKCCYCKAPDLLRELKQMCKQCNNIDSCGETTKGDEFCNKCSIFTSGILENICVRCHVDNFPEKYIDDILKWSDFVIKEFKDTKCEDDANLVESALEMKENINEFFDRVIFIEEFHEYIGSEEPFIIHAS